MRHWTDKELRERRRARHRQRLDAKDHTSKRYGGRTFAEYIEMMRDFDRHPENYPASGITSSPRFGGNISGTRGCDEDYARRWTEERLAEWRVTHAAVRARAEARRRAQPWWKKALGL